MFGKSGRSRGSKETRSENRLPVEDGWVQIFDTPYEIKEWSANGLLASPCTAKVGVGSEIPIDVSIPIDSGVLEFSCRALVVRTNAARQELACMFVMVDRDTRATVDRYFSVFTGTEG